ncbi:hypothetical protein [Methyloferula stellata]|uniref:hypothetical protein n=1 Tax=Methyloferula stellata TaxID=876270 RepID=UPI0003A5D005|nr:hypothetical protein [Methyloferula stellata]
MRNPKLNRRGSMARISNAARVASFMQTDSIVPEAAPASTKKAWDRLKPVQE